MGSFCFSPSKEKDGVIHTRITIIYQEYGRVYCRDAVALEADWLTVHGHFRSVQLAARMTEEGLRLRVAPTSYTGRPTFVHRSKEGQEIASLDEIAQGFFPSQSPGPDVRILAYSRQGGVIVELDNIGLRLGHGDGHPAAGGFVTQWICIGLVEKADFQQD